MSLHCLCRISGNKVQLYELRKIIHWKKQESERNVSQCYRAKHSQALNIWKMCLVWNAKTKYKMWIQKHEYGEKLLKLEMEEKDKIWEIRINLKSL
jgi:hypothetical protein